MSDPLERMMKRKEDMNSEDNTDSDDEDDYIDVLPEQIIKA